MSQVHGLSSGDFAVLFVPAENGCEGCLDYMLDYFKAQHNSVMKQPVYCIVAAPSVASVSRKLVENNLSEQTPNLLTDSHGAFMPYVESDFSQGRVLLFSDGKFAGEMMVKPSELSNIPVVIQQFFQED